MAALPRRRFGLRPRFIAPICLALGCFERPPQLMPNAHDESSNTNASTSTDTTGTTDTGHGTSAGSEVSAGSSSEGSADGGSSESSTGSAPVVIGPLLPATDLDDGAISAAFDGYDARWHPSGESVEGLQYLGEFPHGHQYYGYLRFALPEALPAGTRIDEAVLVLHGHDAYQWDGTQALRVWVQDSADAPGVSGESHYPGISIPLLETSVRWPEELGLAWVFPGPNTSSNLAPVLQALIDAHGGLAEGAHVQLWIGFDTIDRVTNEVGWVDSYAGADTAPSLTITVADAGA